MEKKAPEYLTAIFKTSETTELILGKTREDIVFTADYLRAEIISSLKKDYAVKLREKTILN